MFYYSEISYSRLVECHKDIQLVFNTVIKRRDNSILCGFRDKEDQDKFFKEKKSKVIWPNSKHNLMPSLAIDSSPYPIPDWKDYRLFDHYAGYVLGIADSLNIKLIWGGDWDNDADLNDQTFNDLIHFQLII